MAEQTPKHRGVNSKLITGSLLYIITVQIIRRFIS